VSCFQTWDVSQHIHPYLAGHVWLKRTWRCSVHCGRSLTALWWPWSLTMIWLRISASPETSESRSSRGRWQSFQKCAPSRSLSASCTNLRMTRSCHYSKVVQITGRVNLPSCRSSKTGISQRFVIRCSTISDNLSGIRTEGQTLRGRRSRREVMVLGIVPVSLFGRA